jgi:hypothetical protein
VCVLMDLRTRRQRYVVKQVMMSAPARVDSSSRGRCGPPRPPSGTTDRPWRDGGAIGAPTCGKCHVVSRWLDRMKCVGSEGVKGEIWPPVERRRPRIACWPVARRGGRPGRRHGHQRNAARMLINEVRRLGAVMQGRRPRRSQSCASTQHGPTPMCVCGAGRAHPCLFAQV